MVHPQAKTRALATRDRAHRKGAARDLLVLAFLQAAAPIAAAVLVGIDGRFEGATALRPDGIEIAAADGARTIPFARVIAWSGLGDAPAPTGPQALRTPEGEVWQVELVALRAGKLRVSSPSLGEHELDARAFAAIEFVPGLAPGGRPGWLERERGETVPGIPVWIDRERLALQGPLGPLTFKREELVRYVCTPPAAERKADRAVRTSEVVRADGSILRGELSILPDGSGFALAHPLLGAVRIPSAEVRALVHAPEGILDLGGAVPRAAVRGALLAAAGPEPVLQVVRLAPGCARGLRIEARADVRFALDTGGRTLRFVRAPAEGARGAVRLRISCDGTTVFDEEVSADAPPRACELALPASGELRIEAELGAAIRFPAAVVLGDPHVLPAAGEAR